MTIYKPDTPEVTPEVRLDRWSVFRVAKKDGGFTDHFIGRNMELGDGRVSSPIEAFDHADMVGKTASGRTYRLVGDSGVDMDAIYVFDRWKGIFGVTEKDVQNVTAEYEDGSAGE